MTVVTGAVTDADQAVAAAVVQATHELNAHITRAVDSGLRVSIDVDRTWCFGRYEAIPRVEARVFKPLGG